MKLVLKGVSTQVDIEEGTESHTLDFIFEDGPEGVLSLPVSRETVAALLEQLRGGPEEAPQDGPAEEAEEGQEPEEQEAPVTPPPQVRPPAMPRKHLVPRDRVPSL